MPTDNILQAASSKPSVAPWRPSRLLRQHKSTDQFPLSPSASTRVSVGYDDSDREVSSPDKEESEHDTSNATATNKPPSSSLLQLTNSNPTNPYVGDAEFLAAVLHGLSVKALSVHLHQGSCGGTYWIRDAAHGIPVAVFKPSEEEIGQELNPHGNVDSERSDAFTPGTGYKREILAYRLDEGHSARVPHTMEVSINGRVGSLQRFVQHCAESADYLPGRFPVDDVHRIAILDLRMLNSDRHGGNILVCNNTMRLIPIDHSYVAPSGYADPEFEWMQWPQTRVPFSKETVAYVANLDAHRDRDAVDALLHDEEASECVFAATTALKVAVARGYTAREIAECFRRTTLTQPSRLEELIGQCRQTLDEGGAIDVARFVDAVEAAFPPRSA